MTLEDMTLTITPQEYAEAYRVLLHTRTLDELNEANHNALASHTITLEQFQAAARVLADVIISR